MQFRAYFLETLAKGVACVVMTRGSLGVRTTTNRGRAKAVDRVVLGLVLMACENGLPNGHGTASHNRVAAWH
jgi:hypothetical protein